MRILYFAYGSNMSSVRLRSRIPSVKVVDQAYLKDRKVLFNKRSTDGSGKANLVESHGDVTWGVLYEMNDSDVEQLDRIEKGYQRIKIRVWQPDGETLEAVTYQSTQLTDDPIAYDWYKDLLITGARDHHLPQDYIAYLEQLPAKPDKTKSKPVR